MQKSTYHLLFGFLVAPLVIMLLSTSAFSQDPGDGESSFSLSGQLRPRLEYREGYGNPLSKDQDPAALISERIRLSLNYTYSDIFSVKITPQTVGIWGQQGTTQGLAGTDNKFSLFEAWSDLKLSKYWDMKIGRQVISLDDERFFGELDWAQGGLSHDALSVHYNKNKYELKGFFAFNQNYKEHYNNNLNNPSGNLFSPKDATPYKWMQTAWAGFPLSKTTKLTLLFTNLGFQDADGNTSDNETRFSQTYGANLFHTGEEWDINLSAYYQGGKNNAGMQTSAYLVAAYLGYKPEKRWSAGIGSDLLSGNKVGDQNTKNHSFNPYFQTGHKFYGSMDYYNSSAAIMGSGLSDTYLKGSYAAHSNLMLQLAFHQFLAPDKVLNQDKNLSNDLGQEADLSFSLKLNKFINLMGGYSFLFANETVKYLKNATRARDYQHWAWVSVNITPTFFKARW